MVRLQGKRLVRALVLGLAIFLLVGAGTGFATAASAEDDGSALLAAPRPGDRATYEVRQIIIDADRATPHKALPPMTVNVEWLPERPGTTPAGGSTLARPLGVSWVVYDRETQQSAYHVLFDGADGTELGIVGNWSEPYSHPAVALPFIGPYILEGVQGTSVGVTELLTGTDATQVPCGFGHDHWGREVATGGVVRFAGGCDIDSDASGTPFEVRGWTRVLRHRVLHLTAQGSESELELFLDPDLAVPVRMVARMPDVMDDTFNEGRSFRMDLIGFEPGSGDYTILPKSTPSLLLPLAQAARTPWMVDDAALLHTFPLSAAYAYATDPNSYVADQGGESVPQFLASNPQAYLAYAWNSHAEDSQGAAHDAWGLAWVDGRGLEDPEWIAKMVTRRPATQYVGLPVDLGPAATGTTTTSMVDWDPGFDALSHRFPPVHRLPQSVPTAAATLGLATAVLAPRGGAVPNAYGFTTICYDADCFDSGVLVLAGETKASPSDLDQAIQDQSARELFLGVTESGDPKVVVEASVTQQAPFPVLPAKSDPADYKPAAPQARTTSDAVWSPPTTEAVAGLSFLALVASALYYFWPAIKGAAGLGLFSRIDDGKVLEHPTRRRIHDAIASEPGIHFQALSRKADIGRGALEHHLRKLAAAEVITVRRAPGFTCYFLKGAIDRHMLDAAPSLRTDGSRAVLKAVAAHPGASSRDLAAVLGIAPSTMSYHLKRLEAAGLVAPGEKSGVRVTPLGSQAAA